MADFATAFRKGLQAHEDADRANAEISEVIGEFSAQVRQESDGAIGEVALQPEAPPPVAAVRANFEAGRRFSLVACGAQSVGEPVQRQILCRVRLSAKGYPVGLAFADSDIQCHDRESLENALAELLSHPDTGAKLARLMNRVSPQAPVPVAGYSPHPADRPACR